MNIKYDNWIETYSGIKFHVDDLNPDEINIVDIAHALSNICRFTGHCKTFYSVAQHSVLVCDLLSEHKLEGLLHDSSEAYMNDLHTILKLRLPAYGRKEQDLMEVIAKKYRFQFPFPKEIKVADLVAIEMEHRILFDSNLKWCTSQIDVEEYNLVPLSPGESEKLFLDKFYELLWTTKKNKEGVCC